MAEPATIRNHAAFIWSVADLLRGDYKQSEYGKVILPLVVLRRLDCVLEPTKAKVLAEFERHGDREAILTKAAGQGFYNTSKLDMARLLDDSSNVPGNLRTSSPGSRRPLATLWRSSSSTRRSPASTDRTCSTRSWASSSTSTYTQTQSRTWRWVTSTRS